MKNRKPPVLVASRLQKLISSILQYKKVKGYKEDPLEH